MAAVENLYTGFWINWSYGRVFGATLTLSSQNAAVLNAFLAVLLSFTGTQLWKILIHIYHQARYRKVYVDGLEHQQRVILRNSSNPASTAWALLLQWVIWRKTARTLPLATIALLYTVAVATLSVFVPAQLRADETRLLKPLSCGYQNIDIAANVNRFQTKLLKSSQEASLHSQNCYEANASKLCQSYPVLETIFTRNTSCPFVPGACWQQRNSVPISMTTRLIDSREDLGINTQERVTFRSITTCSLIEGMNKTTEVMPSNSNGLYGLIYYHYGNFGGNNYTYLYNTLASMVNVPYNLFPVSAYPGHAGLWKPIPELNRTDADVTAIFFTLNAVTSMKEIDDPMFGSHYKVNTTSANGKLSVHYIADFYVSLIGCTTQYQLCNPRTGSCSKLNSRDQTFGSSTISELSLTDLQAAVAERCHFAAIQGELFHVINTRSAFALRATSTLANNEQLGIPVDQYLKEMESWYTTGLSMIQKAVRSYAVGDVDNQYPSTELDRMMCSTQRTPEAGDTTSFAFFRLLMVILACFVIIGLSYAIESLVSCMQTHIGLKSRTAVALWKLDDVLYLQRSLFEALSYGKWVTSSWIPTTSDQPFGEIDFRQYRDPRFTEQLKTAQVGFEDADYNKGGASSTTRTMTSDAKES